MHHTVQCDKCDHSSMRQFDFKDDEQPPTVTRDVTPSTQYCGDLLNVLIRGAALRVTLCAKRTLQ
jgi:hypothetical protein